MYQYTAECTAWLCVISQFDSEVKFYLHLCLFEKCWSFYNITTGSTTIQHQNDQCNIQHQCEYGYGELDKTNLPENIFRFKDYLKTR